MRCSVCGSERLSPLGELHLATQRWNDRIQLRFPRGGFFKARPTYEASFARACRDCGAFLPFLSEYARRQLDAEADSLTDITDA
ncbi:hypothetical protein [Streptacidiphilus sp. MAP12-20]|uniref:hypothetical protein n=1 Tax=Streptacidiphilus sp. MAP12-20 TaxID=3156299 RepID=UPI003511CB43